MRRLGGATDLVHVMRRNGVAGDADLASAVDVVEKTMQPAAIVPVVFVDREGDQLVLDQAEHAVGLQQVEHLCDQAPSDLRWVVDQDRNGEDNVELPSAHGLGNAGTHEQMLVDGRKTRRRVRPQWSDHPLGEVIPVVCQPGN